MIKFVLFDLDGTLLSTLDTIAYHLNTVISESSLGGVTVEDCCAFIGDGARKLVSRALEKNRVLDEETVTRVLSLYNESYDADPFTLTQPYDGVTSLVNELYDMGVVLGVVTNKPEPTAIKLIDAFFPGKFAFVRGGCKGIALKPDPTEAIRLLRAFGGKVDECAFVGDTSVDILTAKNMNASVSIGVSWGFRDRDELLSAGADFVIDSAAQVLDIIKGKI